MFENQRNDESPNSSMALLLCGQIPSVTQLWVVFRTLPEDQD
jgi:hypothetical protein